MATTVNKGYDLQATGSNAGTWGATLNTSVFQIIDNNLGAITTKALSSSNVTLSASESQSAILRLTGTLSASVQVTTSCLGFFFVENLTTGAYSVTVTNGVAGIVVPQSARATVISDSTNGCRIASDTIPAGTSMVFHQATAPSGWTQITSSAYNNASLRVVNSTGGGTGGSSSFTDVFQSRTILQTNLPNVSLSGTTNTTGDHAHTYSYTSIIGFVPGSSSGGGLVANTSGTTSTAGNHSHTVSVSLGGSGTPMDFAVKYIDIIVATKN